MTAPAKRAARVIVPCFDDPAAGRHSWENTGLDIVADVLVSTRRCVWCGVENIRPNRGHWRAVPAHLATLMDYATGEAIRPATRAELAASLDAAANHDNGQGVIDIDGASCYVVES